ncbi:ribonuclease P protein component [Arcanobacterium hippocoleae]
MLPAENRIRNSREFNKVFRCGKKSGNALLVVYAICKQKNKQADLPKVGFVVGKTVGNSVVRHAVTRKLRHIIRPMLGQIGASEIVVRAFHPAAAATSDQLEQALRKNFSRLGLLDSENHGSNGK